VIDGYGPAISVSVADLAHFWRLLEFSGNTIINCGKNAQPFYLQGIKLDTVGDVGCLKITGNTILNTSGAERWMTTGIAGTIYVQSEVDIDGSNSFTNIPTFTSLDSWASDPVVLRQLEWCSFTVQITNVAGTMKHCILEDNVNWSTLPIFDRIGGASTTLAATPTLGPAQDFVDGVGYSGVGGTSELVFDVSEQVVGEGSIQATVVINSSNGIPNVIPIIRSEDVNGNTWPRLSLFCFIQGTVNPYALTVANFDPGDVLYIHCQGYLRK
jgi:hypothetical protein